MRFLAASWLVVGLSFFVSRTCISILVFGEIEYTLGAMVLLSTVAPVQAVVLTWALGGGIARELLSSGRMILARPTVRLVWSLEFVVLSVFLAAVTGALPWPLNAQSVLGIGGGGALVAASGLFFKRFRISGNVWTIMLAAFSAILGGYAVATGVGFGAVPLLHFSPVKAAVSIVLPILLVPLMLRAAGVADADAAGSLSLAAVFSGATVSVTPICFYLRPYLGPHWLTPGLVLFSLAATCVLTAAVLYRRSDDSPKYAVSPRIRTPSVRVGVAVWAILVVVFAVVWIGVSLVLVGRWDPSPKALFEVVFVPAGQALAVMLWAAFGSEKQAPPIRRVPMRRVVDLLHVSHAPEKVNSYVQAMRSGDRFPPISVFQLGWFFIVTDGHKRLTACKQLGVDAIDVELWSISRLAGDLAGQSVRHAAAAGKAATGIFRGREGRRQSRQFVTATVAHWKRTVVSLWRLVFRNR